MKHFFGLTLAAVIIIVAGGCTTNEPVDARKSGSYYRTLSGTIEYCVNGNWFELGSKPVPADAESFVVIGEAYAKDKNVVFVGAVPHPEVDVRSFHLDRGVPKDKDHVYRDDGSFAAVADVDVPSFEKVWGEGYRSLWARDAYRYYFRYRPIDADRTTFRKVNDEFYADDSSVFTSMQGDEVRYISNKVRELVVLNDGYIRIADTLYYVHGVGRPELRTYPVTDASSLRVVSRSTICVDGTVIVHGERFAAPEVDASTIEQPAEFVPFLHRDRNHVYYEQSIMEGVDPSTFRRSGDGWVDGKGNRYSRFGRKL